ncbi:mycothiol transferase [Frondihabitans cladoniiphilus]|uniref:DUF664 domain-containing protein n=1 Tax=Frondihabitans cladoniiphilus TaxID=715785 RepID=A0ABP8VNM9_9MICO
MNPLHLLVDGFGRIPPLIERATRNLDASHLATPPAPGANSIAWLAWHTARGQDSWVADLNSDKQVWTSGGWVDRFGFPFPADENGFGMPEQDTARVVASAELLNGYLRAVTSSTLSYLGRLTPDDLDDVVDAARTPAVTRGGQLLSILDDNLQHAGQAGYARGILDRSK